MHFRKWLPIIVGLLLLTAPASAQDNPAPYRVIGYYASWDIYGRQSYVTDIAANKLTVINYAFAPVSMQGGCALGDAWADTQYKYPGDEDGEALLGNFKQLGLLKQSHPGLQTMISIGGWTWSGKFSNVALTAESRQKFITSCLAFMKQYGFDGIDIDWEYPTGGGNTGNKERPEDPENFVLLLHQFRQALDTEGEKDGVHYLLTIAAPASQKAYSRYHLPEIQADLDWINVMLFDYSGAWSSITGFNAPLYDSSANSPEGGSADSALTGYLAAGVPPEKLNMGVAFYGHGWGGVAKTDNGLHQPFTSIPGDPENNGTFDYSVLAARYLDSYPRFWDDTAQVPWLYDAEKGIMISYDDPQSLKLKAEYVREKNLGGVMIWEVGLDDKAHSLLNALYDTLNAD